ncbi:MAG: hypothetical protein V5A43_01315 [Haloarculaceae archaeon]
MTWASLFERADAIAPATSVADVRDELAEHRSAGEASEDQRAVPGSSDGSAAETGERSGQTEDRTDESGGGGGGETEESGRPDPARVVADADVLAADLLVGGEARPAMDQVRTHRWVDLVASDDLLADGIAVVTSLADAELAQDWGERLAALRVRVTHPPGDHPGLASAYAGRAAHLLTFDEGLSSSEANLALRDHLRVSVRTPHAFATLFDPERLYPAVVGGEYPGPDTDPRA